MEIIPDNVLAASSLVVDPENGKMYWTSGGEKPEIGKLNIKSQYHTLKNTYTHSHTHM